MIPGSRQWRERRRTRNEPVPPDGLPLAGWELYALAVAEFAFADEEGTRRVALDEEGAEILAAAGNEGEWL
jgi:hypothetical protein